VSIKQKKPLTPAHSAIKVINTKITPPPPKPLPKREKTCPKDCPGPLESPHCEMTSGEKLNQSHWSYASKLFLRIRSNPISVKEKFDLDISIPTVLNTPLTAEPSQQQESDTDTTEKIDLEGEEENIDEKNINDLTIPAVITLPEAEEENWLESETNCSTVEEKPVITPIEFLKLASSLIPEFDGKA